MCQLPINNPKLMAPINCLMRAGLTVVDYNDKFRMPIIKVNKPLSSWINDSFEMTECKNGINRTVNMCIWRGARIVWESSNGKGNH